MSWKQTQKLHTINSRSAWDKEVPYSMMYPPNMTVDWIDTDIEESAQYKKDIKYAFNEYGFRSDPFYERKDINVLALGCSMTVGVGVDQEENWPNGLKRRIQEWSGYDVSMWNMATSGASTDYVARTVHKVITLLDPDIVVIMWPPITRLELPTPHAGKVTQASLHMPLFPEVLMDEDYLMYNYYRNLALVKGIIKPLHTSLFCNPLIETPVQNQMYDENPFTIDTTGRDGMHPGPDWHDRVANYYFNGLVDEKKLKNLQKIKDRLDNPKST